MRTIKTDKLSKDVPITPAYIKEGIRLLGNQKSEKLIVIKRDSSEKANIVVKKVTQAKFNGKILKVKDGKEISVSFADLNEGVGINSGDLLGREVKINSGDLLKEGLKINSGQITGVKIDPNRTTG